MKKLTVNENACIGCGACVALDNEHFDFSDAGFSTVISNENIECESVQTAIDSCPTSAISIIEVADSADSDSTKTNVEACPTNIDEDNSATESSKEEHTTCEGNCEHCNHEEKKNQ